MPRVETGLQLVERGERQEGESLRRRRLLDRLARAEPLGEERRHRLGTGGAERATGGRPHRRIGIAEQPEQRRQVVGVEPHGEQGTTPHPGIFVVEPVLP